MAYACAVWHSKKNKNQQLGSVFVFIRTCGLIFISLPPHKHTRKREIHTHVYSSLLLFGQFLNNRQTKFSPFVFITCSSFFWKGIEDSIRHFWTVLWSFSPYSFWKFMCNSENITLSTCNRQLCMNTNIFHKALETTNETQPSDWSRSGPQLTSFRFTTRPNSNSTASGEPSANTVTPNVLSYFLSYQTS